MKNKHIKLPAQYKTWLELWQAVHHINGERVAIIEDNGFMKREHLIDMPNTEHEGRLIKLFKIDINSIQADFKREFTEIIYWKSDIAEMAANEYFNEYLKASNKQ